MPGLNSHAEDTQAMGDLYQYIFESLNIAVMMLTEAGKIIALNPAAEQLTGMTSDFVLGRHFDDILGTEHFSHPKLRFNHFYEMKEVSAIETQLNCKEKTFRDIRVTALPVKSSSGESFGLALMLQDVTRIKKLEEEANRNGRLAAMGEMAVQIAHDIRNPLGSIELFASLLQKDLQGLEESQKLADHISSGVRSINNIVSNLLLFIKPEQQTDMQVLDLHKPLKDSLFFAEHLINSGKSIELRTDFCPQELTIRGDAELLSQVSLNLILNAIQAMPDGGRLSISTKKISDVQSGQAAEIKIADTGCGIPQANLPKIFDPFFTTKKNGTGLGLSIVHNITKAHDGHIDISSTETSGTTCIVTFPLRQHGVARNECKHASGSGRAQKWA